MDKVKVAIVGAGTVSDSHALGFQRHNDAEVVAWCTTRKETAEPKAKQWNVPKVYTNYDEMLKDDEINSVDIITPTGLHGEQVVKAAEAGKHIHCEKPFCNSVAEGEKMVQAAKDNNVVLTVGESYVFTPTHIKAREILESGAIGEPMQIRERFGEWVMRKDQIEARRKIKEQKFSTPLWRVDPKMSGGGTYPWIYDHAVHFFAIARYLMLDEDIETVYALSGSFTIDKEKGVLDVDEYEVGGVEKDIPIITWRYKNRNKQGVYVRAEKLINTYDFRLGFSTVINGTNGMLEVLGEGGKNLIHKGKQVHLILYKEDGTIEPIRIDMEDGDRFWESEVSYYDLAHVNQVKDFIDDVVHGKKNRYNGSDGTREVKLTLAAIKSAEEDRPILVDEIPDDYTAY